MSNSYLRPHDFLKRQKTMMAWSGCELMGAAMWISLSEHSPVSGAGFVLSFSSFTE